MKAIYFDMDGTIANLYNQPNWLHRLRSEDVTPYTNAEVMIDIDELKATLNILRANGYIIGVISWLSMNSSKPYARAVRQAKRQWLNKFFGKGFFDEIHLVKYGTPKHKVANVKQAVIVDDNKTVRANWNLGQALDVHNILGDLATLT